MVLEDFFKQKYLLYIEKASTQDSKTQNIILPLCNFSKLNILKNFYFLILFFGLYIFLFVILRVN
jgi:hypothetical protein